MPGRRKAAVLGSPIAHSRSPQLHLAAYRALGLTDWTYERIECTAEQLPGLVGGLGPEWVGVSVTMPGKEEALRLADGVGEDALLTGAANTLVRRQGGWWAENTDVHGLTVALTDAGLRGFEVVVFLHTDGEGILNAAQRTAFERWTSRGGGA